MKLTSSTQKAGSDYHPHTKATNQPSYIQNLVYQY